jgi:uncharacterized integral membrane protein
MVPASGARNTRGVTDFLEQDAAAFAAANPSRPPVPLADQIPVPPPPIPRSRNIWHLLWTVPLAFIISIPILVVAAIAKCGIYSCGWGGQTGWPIVTLGLCLVIGAVFAFAVGAVPWTRSREGQTTAALTSGSIASIAALWFCFGSN